MKAIIDKHGNLIKITAKGYVLAFCPFNGAGRNCNLSCPHLDDSEPEYIRLTCGGTDLVFENANHKKEDQQDEL